MTLNNRTKFTQNNNNTWSDFVMKSMFKYYLNMCSICLPENELSNIIAWSVVNKLALNLVKTKEIVFHRPRPSKYCLPPPLSSIERVSSVKLLGVHLTDRLV